ncbi:MAG: peptidase M64, partial [Gemmatimonadota bacterium]
QPVSSREVIWIETPHPNYHELKVTWEIDGRAIPEANDQPHLALGGLSLGAGEHSVTVKVVDPTEFVRDPVMRDTSFSATRSWVVDPAAPVTSAAEGVAFTTSTQTARPVAGSEVVYVETTHPSDRVLGVTWRLNGRVVSNAANRRTFNLASQKLSPGAHRLSASVTDPGNTRAASQTLNWTVDNTGPKVAVTLSPPIVTATRPDRALHYVMRDQFTMKLDPTDDQAGYVVAEFRVNGDGWHHYYGWPDAVPGTPYRFTARGTTIKELVYGSLSVEGLSPQPWEPREPGWGTHRIEYRARDAAGNIGASSQFFVTVLPAPTCTSTITVTRYSGDLVVQSGVTCVTGTAISGRVTVSPGASFIATNATIRGGLTATNAGVIELTGSEISGAVRIDGTTGHLALVGNRITQSLSCTGNAKLYVGPNTARSATGQCGGNR